MIQALLFGGVNVNGQVVNSLYLLTVNDTGFHYTAIPTGLTPGPRYDDMICNPIMFRFGHTAVWTNGNMYIHGGCGNNATVPFTADVQAGDNNLCSKVDLRDDVWVFNPNTLAWSKRLMAEDATNCPNYKVLDASRMFHTAAAVEYTTVSNGEKSIVLFGGHLGYYVDNGRNVHIDTPANYVRMMVEFAVTGMCIMS